MSDLVHALAPLLIVVAFAAAQVARATRRRSQRIAAELLAALAPIEPPSPAAAAQPASRLPQPIARRAKPAGAVAPVVPAAPKPLLKTAGPRWAANAVIAAEVFGPPRAL
jgi:hypothetical protein